MGYNPKFNLNPEQLELIETALRAELGRLAKPDPEAWKKKSRELQSVQRINELLGHLHNQKLWFNPKEHVPLG